MSENILPGIIDYHEKVYGPVEQIPIHHTRTRAIHCAELIREFSTTPSMTAQGYTKQGEMKRYTLQELVDCAICRDGSN